MKIPRFLKTLMALFVCIAFIRAVNNAGGLSVKEIITDLQKIEFDFSSITQLLDYFTEKEFATQYYAWNNELTGIDGFATNFKNTMVSMFDIIGNVFVMCIKGIWSILVQTLKIIGQLLNLTLKVTGFKS